MRPDAALPPGGLVFRHFRLAFIVTACGLLLGGAVGWNATTTAHGTLAIFFICAVLAVREISLAVDNAIVIANKPKTMSPQWQLRFVTWGILIAVLGMQVDFPPAIPAVAAHVGPWQALVLAVAEPGDHARIIQGAHLSITTFGGAFLLVAGLSFFFDIDKDKQRVRWVEVRMSRAAGIRGFEILRVPGFLLDLAGVQETMARSHAFLGAAAWGLLTLLAVDAFDALPDSPQEALEGAAKGGPGALLHLEGPGASLSFDGVIAAFALSQNLLVIAIGLGIVAMHLRSMAIMRVARETSKQ